MRRSPRPWPLGRSLPPSPWRWWWPIPGPRMQQLHGPCSGPETCPFGLSSCWTPNSGGVVWVWSWALCAPSESVCC